MHERTHEHAHTLTHAVLILAIMLLTGREAGWPEIHPEIQSSHNLGTGLPNIIL